MDDIVKLGTILGVWAHPDDDSFMAGGILSRAAANGQTVICVTATKGEGGVQDESKWPAATLGETREKEQAAALEVLGVANQHWLDYADGGCDKVADEEAVGKIVELIDKYQPDTIITFPPDGLTGHTDHQAVSRWARKAAIQSSKKPEVYFAVHTQELYDAFLQVADEQFNLYFATDKPILVPEVECDLLIHLEPAAEERKMHALQVMPSQFTKWFEVLGDKGVEFALSTEALVSAKNDSRWAGL